MTTFRKRTILAALLMALPSAAAATPLDYETALAIALDRDFGVRRAREMAAEAELQRGYAKSAFLPRLDLSGSWQQTDGEETEAGLRSDYETDALAAGLNLRWTLFDGLSIFVERARQNELADRGLLRSRELVESRVTAFHSAYFSLVQGELLMAVMRENRDLSADRLERERLRRELGALSKAQFFSAQTAYNSDLSAFLAQEIALREARRALRLMLGMVPGEPLDVQAEIPLPALDSALTDLLAAARSDNVELVATRLDARLAARDMEGARARLWPSVEANAGWQWRDMRLDPAAIDTENRDLSLGLSLNYALFDGDRRRLALKQSRAALRQAEISLEESESALDSELREALAVWERRLELAELEAENVEAAAARLELEEERYRAGSATSLDFRDAQLALAQARAAEIGARYQARIARHEIERLTGRLVAP